MLQFAACGVVRDFRPLVAAADGKWNGSQADWGRTDRPRPVGSPTPSSSSSAFSPVPQRARLRFGLTYRRQRTGPRPFGQQSWWRCHADTGGVRNFTDSLKKGFKKLMNNNVIMKHRAEDVTSRPDFRLWRQHVLLQTKMYKLLKRSTRVQYTDHFCHLTLWRILKAGSYFVDFVTKTLKKTNCKYSRRSAPFLQLKIKSWSQNPTIRKHFNLIYFTARAVFSLRDLIDTSCVIFWRVVLLLSTFSFNNTKSK